MTVNVAAVNDAPVANNDTLAATEDTAVTYTAAQLLGNDTDADGNPLAIAAVTSGTGGTAVLNAERHGDVHAGGELQRRGELQLYGDRRLGHQQRATVTVNVAATNDGPTISAGETAQLVEFNSHEPRNKRFCSNSDSNGR